ncbi:MAG: sugar ABC transporter ATP-binding protein, partial [Spirochaetes bacterium]
TDKLGLIDSDKINKNIRKWIANLDIKVPSSDAPVQTLSGGNQQRVVLAKWIATDPKILILDGPTVGIDIAAKSSIHDIIKTLAKENRGIIIISDEVQEVLYNCTKIIVMHKGKFIAELKAEETSETEIQNIINNAE